ncbi:PEP-CTERM sorting domain-containing protein [Nostoc sp. UCD121]|uniref:PEP-CTERM sorting domain-containing protein n=1 Tax=unclassified Nostoc TaxID=2593658 RepID=UPI0016258B61|nr:MULTISPECIES: PEP-CTERM sorting domain-containing protein [unclassified Nostoc]MBC1225051.1 PEP-CTERM sorting domain-containing protein [Nostoc sp. UCD120]MBC1278361.1 PEP-CTERM sorting domain-containing protein [Nostoc sp. UCD121]
MKLVSQLILSTSCALIFAATGANSASAAIINYAFSVDSFITKGEGFFSYDDSTFSEDNIPVVIVKSLNFQFDNDPNIYTEKDDTEYPGYPIVFPTTFLTGIESVGLQYVFPDKANPSSSITYDINGYDFAITSAENIQIGSGKVTYRQVPEPTILGGSFIACSISWFMKKKLTLDKKVKA